MDPNKIPMPNQVKEEVNLGQDTEKTPTQITVQNREQAVDLVLRSFDVKLRERFTTEGKNMSSKEFQEYLAFHGPEHSQKVEETTLKFLETVRNVDPSLISKEDIDMAKIKARGHDLVQKALVAEDLAMRMRTRGAEESGIDIPANVKAEFTKREVTLPESGNERASADEIIKEIQRFVVRGADGTTKPVFEVDPVSVYNDIALTLPGFNFAAKLPDGSVGLEVYQPFLTMDLASVPTDESKWQQELEKEGKREVSITGLAIASADLRGEMASNNPEDFRQSGDAEFREIMTTINREVENWQSIAPDRRAQIAESIIGWKKSQTSFAKWQRVLFITSVDQNKIINSSEKSNEIKAALFKQFGLPEDDSVIKKEPGQGNFGDNIRYVENEYKRIENEYGLSKEVNQTDGEYKLARAAKIAETVKDDSKFEALLKEIGYLKPIK